MSSCLMSPKSRYVFWFFPAAALFDLIPIMLRCFTTHPTSCCLAFSTSDLWFLIVWSCLDDATLLDLDRLMLCCLMSPTSGCAFLSGLHGARLLDLPRLMLPLDLPCVMLGCFLHGARLLDLPRLMLPLDLPCVMLCCLIFSKSCCLMFLYHIVLCCLVLSSWCYAAWSSLHHASLQSERISSAKVLAPKTILGAQVFRVWHQQRH